MPGRNLNEINASRIKEFICVEWGLLKVYWHLTDVVVRYIHKIGQVVHCEIIASKGQRFLASFVCVSNNGI